MHPACFCSADSIPRELRHLSLSAHGVTCRKSRVCTTTSVISATGLDLLPDFPVLGIVAVVAGVVVVSSLQETWYRGDVSLAPLSIIAATSIRPSRAVSACLQVRRPSNHYATNSIILLAIINLLHCVAHASGSPDAPLSLHNGASTLLRWPKSFRDQYRSSCPPHVLQTQMRKSSTVR